MRLAIRIFVLMGLSFLAMIAVKAQETDKTAEMQPLIVTAFSETGYLKDLTPEHFDVSINSQPASIISFERKEEPVSVGFLVDISSSMQSAKGTENEKMRYAVKVFPRFFEITNPANDYFVVSFAKEIKILLDSTQDQAKLGKVLEELAENKLRESDTQFYEALKMSLEKLSSAKNSKRILIVVTDGQNNGKTKLKIEDIEKLAVRDNVLIYIIRMISGDFFDTNEVEQLLSFQKIPLFARDYNRIQFEVKPFPAAPSNMSLEGIKKIDTISLASGGRVFYPVSESETAEAFRILAEELKSQYKIVAKPSSKLKINALNEIKIKSSKAVSAKKVSVRVRKGVYF